MDNPRGLKLRNTEKQCPLLKMEMNEMIQKIKQLLIKYREMIMYLIFGVLTTVVNWAATFICQKVFGLNELGIKTMIANAIAWVTAVTFAFLTNRKFVFEKTGGSFWAELVKFFLARAFTGLFEIFLPDALAAIADKVSFLSFIREPFFGITGGIAKLITSVVVIILNYVLSKLVVFRKKKDDEVTD